jgi:hypothetical protein
MMQHGMKVINDGPVYSHSGGTVMKEAKDDKWDMETVYNLAMNIINILQYQKL